MAIITWAMSWHTPRPSAHASAADVRTPVTPNSYVIAERDELADGEGALGAGRAPSRRPCAPPSGGSATSAVVSGVDAGVDRAPRTPIAASRERWSTARTPNEKRSADLGGADLDDGVAEAVVAVAQRRAVGDVGVDAVRDAPLVAVARRGAARRTGGAGRGSAPGTRT